LTEDQAKAIAGILRADHDRFDDEWGVMVSRADGCFAFISGVEVKEYLYLDALSARQPTTRISLAPTRWDQALNFAIERAEVEYLKARRDGITDPVPVINLEEFEEVEDFSAPIAPGNIKVHVLDRATAIHWVAGVDGAVYGLEVLENRPVGSMTMVVISRGRADVISRFDPAE
jgi:hypothetical protein